jgi:photosystem II stability/assembly factor-like uncharacterized protein
VYDDPSVTVSALYVSGSDIYAGTKQGIVVSIDSGITWATLDSGLTNTNVQSIILVDGALLAGTQGDGVYRSTDSGLSWSADNAGLTGTYVATLFHSGANLFVGDFGSYPGQNFYNGGALRSTDDGVSWKSISPDSVVQDVIFLGIFDSTIFMDLEGNEGIALYTSSNYGSTWNLIDSNFDESYGFSDLSMIGNNLIAGSNGDGIFRSTDMGRTWETSDSGLAPYARVFSFCVNGSSLFAATYNGLYRSDDSGSIWERVDNGLTDTDFLCLAKIGNNLFAGDVNFKGVFLSTDDGASWNTVNNGLPYQAFVYAFATLGTTLFAGTDIGVYLTTDFGNSWAAVNAGLPIGSVGTTVANLAIDQTYLFATVDTGSYANTVWRRPLSEMIPQSSVTTTPATIPTFQSYPNPFSRSTTISVTVPGNSYSEISITNLLGMEVDKVYSGTLGAGTRSFEWNPSDLPNGVYECQVQMNGQTRSIPLVLSR